MRRHGRATRQLKILVPLDRPVPQVLHRTTRRTESSVSGFTGFLAARIHRLEQDLAKARRQHRQTLVELEETRAARDRYRQLAIRGAIQEAKRRETGP